MSNIRIRYTGRNLKQVKFRVILTLQEIEDGQYWKWLRENNIVPSSVKRDRNTGVSGKNMEYDYLHEDNEIPGPEIFENDICRWHTTEGGFDPVWSIVYNGEIACYTMGELPIVKIFDSGFYQPGLGKSGIEILGDIHLNPELLGERE